MRLNQSHKQLNIIRTYEENTNFNVTFVTTLWPYNWANATKIWMGKAKSVQVFQHTVQEKIHETGNVSSFFSFNCLWCTAVAFNRSQVCQNLVSTAVIGSLTLICKLGKHCCHGKLNTDMHICVHAYSFTWSLLALCMCVHAILWVCVSVCNHVCMFLYALHDYVY